MKMFVRWTGTLLGLVAFVLLVIIAAGTALPVDHTATCAADIGAPAHAVWKAIAYPSGSDASAFPVVSRERDRRVVRRVADPASPFGGTWRIDVAPTRTGSHVAIEEDGEIYNPVFRLLSRYFIGYTSTMRQYLSDLGKRFGSSNPVACPVVKR